LAGTMAIAAAIDPAISVAVTLAVEPLGAVTFR
jgi:hypothetical protein